MLHNKLSVHDLTLIAILAVILFVQEEILTFLPNIQLTFFLIILYSKKLGYFKTSLIILIHVILDNLVMGSMNVYFTAFMYIGYLLIPLTLNTLFKKVENKNTLSILGIFYSLIYCWIYIIPNVFLYRINVIAYLVADFPFEIILASCTAISVLLLYEPCSKAFEKLIKNQKRKYNEEARSIKTDELLKM